MILAFFFSSSVKEEMLGSFVKYLKINQDKHALLLVIVVVFIGHMASFVVFSAHFGCQDSSENFRV